MNTLASRLTSTRAGAILLGLVAAAIAAILLVVYVTHYRKSVNAESASVQVLVAKRLIPAGTTGDTIGRKQLYAFQTVAKSAVQPGAFTDPGSLTNAAAATDIFPGSQLTGSNIVAGGAAAAATDTSSLPAQLKATQRAVAIQIDLLNGDLSNLQAGDHVDIYQELRASNGTVVKLFRANVPVLQVNTGAADASGSLTGQIVLAVPAQDSADVLYASRHTTLSFVLRPAKGSSVTPPSTADNQTMLQYSRTH